MATKLPTQMSNIFVLLVLLEIQCFSINYFSEPIITGEHSFHGLLAEVV